MRGKDLTVGKIPSLVWTLAWPTILSFFFQTLYNFVDAFWVAKLAEEAIPAVSISQVSLFLMISLGLGVTVGSGVLMSMNIGRKNIAEAERILGQAFVLAFLISVFFTVFSFIFKHEILVLSGAAGAIYPLALEYFEITAAGSVLAFLQIVLVFSFNAQGDTKTVTLLFALSAFLNLVLDPLFIFGIGDWNGWGMRGAAVATLISQAVMLTMGIRILSGPKMMVRFHLANVRAKWESVKKVLHIGLPAAFTQILNPISFALVNKLIVDTFSEAGAIGFSVGFRIENFAFLPAIGFSAAAMAMIGQNVGARNLERSRESHKKAQLFAFIAGSGIGLLAVALQNPILAMLSVTDPLSSGYALSYLVSVPFTYGIFAMNFVNVGSLQATGKSWPSFWINLFQAGFIVVASTILVNGFGADLWAIWLVYIAARILTLGLSQLIVMNRFAQIGREFQNPDPAGHGGFGGPGGQRGHDAAPAPQIEPDGEPELEPART